MKNKFYWMLSSFLLITLNMKAQVTETFTDPRDGKTYKTIQIGTQVWMSENLAFKTEHGCWAYENNPDNLPTYGYLYNWETSKNVCPSGWHLPMDTEWTILTTFLGGEAMAGDKLKETGTTHWGETDAAVTNESGFGAVGGGFRLATGFFLYLNGMGYWWSATENDNATGKGFGLTYANSSMLRFSDDKRLGFSVRCVKD